MTLDPRNPAPGRPKSAYAVSRTDHNDVLRALDKINMRLSRIEGGLMLGGFLAMLGVAIVAVIAGRI